MTSFTTQFGHEIPFIPGYFERNNQVASYTKSSKLHAGLEVVDRPYHVGSPLKDWVEFSSLIHFMGRSGVLRNYDRMVDLGGADGSVARFFKGMGLVKDSTNVDIDDYTKVATDELFLKFAALISDLDALTPEATALVQRSKQAFAHFHHSTLPDGLMTKFPLAPTLDRNIHASVMDIEGQWDLITSLCCFDYFDINSALKKVKSLLAPGGVFVGFFEYWWWPLNSTGVLGHFPYACQRLSFEDLERYIPEHHPEYVMNLYEKYHYFHEGMQHPTITDWFNAAVENGLRPVAVERVTPLSHHRHPETPYHMFASPWFDYREVLRDIHHLKPDVTVDDLFTSIIKVALLHA